MEWRFADNKVVKAHPDNEALRQARHRGAHEYIGEVYLLVNDLPNAEKHLAALRGICLLPCEELEDLEREVAAYKAKRPG